MSYGDEHKESDSIDKGVSGLVLKSRSDMIHRLDLLLLQKSEKKN